MEKSYETGWERHGDTWRPPAGGATLPQELRALQDSIFPVGFVNPHAGAAAPPGWLLCNGAAVSRQVYGRLFSIIGTSYGAGDGTTTFNVPNLKGRIIVMQDTAQAEFTTLGQTGGSKNIVAGAVPAHTHGFGHTHGTDSSDNNHAHNVYARDVNHLHSFDHWHTASIGNVHWNGTQTHGHHDRGGITSEAPWEGANWAGAVPVNVAGTGAGGTGWMDRNASHDHPSTNYNGESPWPGNRIHSHSTTSQSTSTTDNGTGGGSAAGNMPPFMVMNYCIKA